MKNKVAFYEVARLAGVSPATVSRVAAGLQNVDPEMRDRVRRAAHTLGLDLERRRDAAERVIAFVLSNRDVSHGFQARVLAGAESYLTENEWEMVFLTYRYSQGIPPNELHLPHILRRRTPARGVILAGTNSSNLLQALGERAIPVSVLGNNLIGECPKDTCDLVYSDDVQGAYELNRHLINQGHRHIWFIGDTRYPWFSRCARGYKRAMDEAGLQSRLCGIRSDGPELGYLGTKSILSRNEPVTAIFAGSDDVASGVYTALRGSSVSIPGDISVVGFNDTCGRMFHPALSTVREFPEELGRHLAELTLNRIRNPALSAQELTIPTQLVVRDSIREIAVGEVHPAVATSFAQ